MQSKHKIAVTDPLADSVIDYLNSHTNIEVDIMYGVSHTYLQQLIGEYDALIVRSRTKVTEFILNAGRNRLKAVGTATAGVDHIDLQTAQGLKIPVVNSPWGNSLANAEYIIGMMIALSRNLIHYHNLMKAGIWNQEYGIGPELAGKTFGTIGFGKIGSLAAEKARGLGMKVLAHDPFQNESSFDAKMVKNVELKEILEQSDFLSLSLPFYSRTVDLIGEQELALVKPSCYVIQSSRGGIINEDTLIKCLKEKRIAGACIDVFKTEPRFNKEFLELPNVILTPHIGCSSQESRVRSGICVAKDIVKILSKEKPVNTVTPVSEENFHRLLG